MVALGGPPIDADATAMAAWAYKLNMLLADEARTDVRLSPSERRTEVRRSLDAAAKHMTDALRFDTMQAIQREREAMEAKKRGRAQARLQTTSAPPDSAKVIPIRRDG